MFRSCTASLYTALEFIKSIGFYSYREAFALLRRTRSRMRRRCSLKSIPSCKGRARLSPLYRFQTLTSSPYSSISLIITIRSYAGWRMIVHLHYVPSWFRFQSCSFAHNWKDRTSLSFSSLRIVLSITYFTVTHTFERHNPHSHLSSSRLLCTHSSTYTFTVDRRGRAPFS